MGQTAALLSRIKLAYPNFVNVVQKAPNGQIAHAPTANLWHQRLSANRVTLEQALHALDKHIDSSRFEPTISDIINNKPQLSNYDIQRIEAEQEQLLLEEYHANNNCVPMPDSVIEMLEAISAKSRAGVPKDE